MSGTTPIYLDYAAATPLDDKVLAAMQPYFSRDFYNPSATYGPGLEAHKTLEAARAGVALVLGARPAEITFTAGGTEANNLAVHGVMRHFAGSKLLVSAVEHESVLAPSAEYDYQIIKVGQDGVVDLDDLQAKIDDQTVLISVMYANNEVGTVQPVRQTAAIVNRVRSERLRAGNRLPLYLHTDAAQAANYLDLHVSRLGVDLMTLNGGKIYGPKQSGALFVKGGLSLKPLISGGGQEHGLRSGTENLAAAAGFAAALEKAQAIRTDEVKRLAGLQQEFFKLLTKQLPQAVINGSLKQRLPNNLHLTLPGQDNERLLIKLDQAGVLAAAGSACSASDEEPSHVLKAMGLSDAEARASLRFTMGRQTTLPMVKKAVQALAAAIA